MESTALLKEYNRWSAINSILRKYQDGNKKDLRYVLRSISTYLIERMNNLDASTEYIQEYLRNANIPLLTEDDVKILESSNPDAGNRIPPSYEYKFLNTEGTLIQFRVGAYKISYPREVITQLQQRASDIQIAILLMRYAPYQSGHFWSIPLEAYDMLHTSGFQVECFASPMNHYIPTYYSMFPDVDAQFGSIGNFFTTFLSSKAERFVINPPFSYPMIRRVVEFCINRSMSRTTILFYGPNWPKGDIPASYQQLMNAYTTSVSREVPEKKHYIYDYSTGGKVPASYSAKVVLVSNFDTIEWCQTIINKFVDLISVPSF